MQTDKCILEKLYFSIGLNLARMTVNDSQNYIVTA